MSIIDKNKIYSVTLTASIEASSEDEAIKSFLEKPLSELNTGDNIEAEIEGEACPLCGAVNEVGEDCFFCEDGREKAGEDKPFITD